MLLRTSAAVTPDKQRTAVGSGVFMPRTLRVRSYRQRKAGACGRYSHATYMAGPTTGLPLQRSLLVLRFYFSRSGRCRVLCVCGIAQKGTAAMTDQLAAHYEGTEPFLDAGGPPRTVAGAVRVAVTLAIVIVPFAGLGVAVWLAWGPGLRLADVLLAAAFYLVTGLGVTIGFHRLLTHRSFTAAPALRVLLAIAGSMSFEGKSSAGSPSTAVITPLPTGRETRIRRTGTEAACSGNSAVLPMHTSAGCCGMTPPRSRAMPPTWRPTRPCGRSRQRFLPCARCRSGCRSAWAGQSAAGTPH